MALIAGIVSGSQAFQSCFQEQKHADTYKALYESINIILKSIIRLRLNAECGLTFLDKDSGAITALATVAIAGFTLTLWRATTEQGRLAQKSIDLARDEFQSTHRPRIRIKHLFLESDIWQGEPIVVTLVCVNCGTTDAVLHEIGIRYHVVGIAKEIPIQTEIIPLFTPTNVRLASGLNHVLFRCSQTTAYHGLL